MAAPAVEFGGSGSLQEAAEKIFKLCNLQIPVDPHPNIHVGSVGIEYVADLDSKFHDGNVYVAAVAKFLEESTQLADMLRLMDEAEKYSSMLYTWRSCSMTLPQGTQPELYQTTMEVLDPEIEKLKAFMAFQKEAVARFQKEVAQLSANKSKFVTEARLLTVGRFISMLATLDELKNMKASIINDYAYYKRACERSRRDPGGIIQMQEMNMFLATHNVILTQVKTCLSEISGFEEVLCNVINTCVCWFEQKQYLVPKEKYGLVKVIGYSLYLVDSEKVNINKLHSKKKIDLKKIDAIFKDVEVVPLFGDLMIGPFMYIKKTPNYDPAHWEKCCSLDVSRQSQLLSLMPAYRRQHAEVITEFITVTQPLDLSQFRTKKQKTCSLVDEKKTTPEQNIRIYNVTEKCLRALSTWTTSISELFSWKLLHPAEPSERPGGCPTSAEIYERATRYNYSAAEKSALVELIGLIKGLQSLIRQNECSLQRSVNSEIYRVLQEFVSQQLSEPLRKAVKHTKNVISSTLSAVQNVAVDCPPVDKSASRASVPSVVPSKCVLPSTTQLFLVRMMLESLVSKADKDGSHKSPRKDIDPAHVRIIESFLQTSFVWPYFMDIHGSLEACCDLSQLWYREFYLEMTKGERIQFPIEMSFPWILTDHILEKRDPTLIHYILYPLDLYNDSAQCALRIFRKQFLYDEIEAEVRLCFDQFVYKLSEHIFEYYKILAGSSFLNKTFQNECKKMGVQFQKQTPINYIPLMQQQNIQLLGRTVDLRHLISQRMNDMIIQSLKAAITRFEASDITGVVELEGLIRVNHETHKRLGEHLMLDEFSALLNEANNCVKAPWGRIPLYILLEIDQFFLPHFCYNAATNRFIKTVLSFADEVPRDKLPTAAPYHLWGSKNLTQYFTAIYSRYRSFIGPPHFNAICSLLNYQEVAFLLSELLEILKNSISHTLLPYLRALQKVMPKRCMLPRYEYTSPGVLGYFQAQLTDITAYADLKPKVFQCLRVVGNAVLFALQLENSLSQREISELALSAMFQNNIPKQFVSKKDADEKQQEAERQTLVKNLQSKYRHQHISVVIAEKGSEEQVTLCKEHVVLSREKLCSGLLLFSSFLTRLGSFLKSDPMWQTMVTSDGVWVVENNTEFHRLWSAMQFVLCWPPGPHEFTVEELFGEGLNWAGCTLVILLGQHRRYETMDFCSHLQKIYKVDQMEKSDSSVSVRKMVDRIRKFQILNDQIYSQLNKHLHSSTNGDLRNDYAVQVEHFQPPSVGASLSLRTSTSIIA